MNLLLRNKVVAFAYLSRFEEARAGLARPIEFQLGLSIAKYDETYDNALLLEIAPSIWKACPTPVARR